MKSMYKRIAIQLQDKLNELGFEDAENYLAETLQKLYEDAWQEGYDEAIRGRD